MKLSYLIIIPGSYAFTASPVTRTYGAFTTSLSSTTSTTLHSSMGMTDSKDFISTRAAYGVDRSRDEEDNENPEENIQSYITEPEPVAARPSLDGTVLVSGYVQTKERTDQLVFDFLNSEESAFAFDKIIALVPDMKFAKKRLLSRSARYTGLLDKLDFMESSTSLPSVEQLDGVKHWVAHLEGGAGLSLISQIADLASKASSVVNLSILLSNANGIDDVSGTVSAIKALDDLPNLQYSIVSVGKLEDYAEGSKPYSIYDFGTDIGVVPSDAVYSRDESMRVVTECLGLASGARKAITFVECETDDVGAKLIRGLRQAGYTRPQEIDHMITKGVKAYGDAIEEYKQKVYERENPDPEEQAKLQQERDRQAELDWEKTEKEFADRKKKEIEDNARAWAKREYFRRSMGGNMGMTEEEFIQKNWDRAMFEGDLKYRMMHGGKTDERKELADFTKKQEAKKEAALKKARKALEDKLGDVLDTTSIDDDDDDDDKDSK